MLNAQIIIKCHFPYLIVQPRLISNSTSFSRKVPILNIVVETLPGSRSNVTVRIDFYANPKPTQNGTWKIPGIAETSWTTSGIITNSKVISLLCNYVLSNWYFDI